MAIREPAPVEQRCKDAFSEAVSIVRQDSIVPGGRILALQGCWNARDLGGLMGAGGKRVRRGRVFRAAALDRATDDDIAAFASLGLRRVFDLRSDRERAADRRLWCEGLGIQPWKRDYKGNAGNLLSRLDCADGTNTDMHAAMVESYRGLAREQAPAIAAILAAIAGGETPILFHCAVGKDRTGMVAALVLALLGVAREDILDDYLLTNFHTDSIRARLFEHPYLQAIGRDAAHVWAPLASAHPDYLNAFFNSIELEAAGSVDLFVEAVAGIGARSIADMRRELLE